MFARVDAIILEKQRIKEAALIKKLVKDGKSEDEIQDHLLQLKAKQMAWRSKCAKMPHLTSYTAIAISKFDVGGSQGTSKTNCESDAAL